MQVVAVVLSCFLLAQPSPETAQPSGADPLAPISRPDRTFEQQQPEQQEPGTSQLLTDAASAATPEAVSVLAPPELVARSLAIPESTALDGLPFSLAEALTPAQGPLARLQVVRAYWQLVEAVGQYRAALDESGALDGLGVAPADELVLRAARLSARAAVERAKLSAVTAQYDLATAALLPSDSPLPLPADLPHVGPYRTNFEDIYTAREAPPRARLLDRELPLRRRVVDLRADAVVAADKALAAATNAYHTGQCDAATVARYAADRSRQLRALLTAVCRYNDDIAEYALAIVSPQADAREVVATLITPRQSRPVPETAGISGVRPATRNEPVTEVPAPAEEPSASGVPTLAPPRESVEPSETGDAMPERLREISPTAERDALPIQPIETGPAAKSEPATPDVEPQRPMVPIPARPLEPSGRLANRPVLDALDTANATGLYPALVGKAPAVQAKQLAAALGWVRQLPEPSGEPITLKECLRGVPSANRSEVIEKYWLAAEKAEVYQALAVRHDALEELAAILIAEEGAPDGHSDRLKVAQSAAEAELVEAQRGLLESQLALSRAAGRPADAAWLLPTTQPLGSPYRLKLDAQPAELVRTWPIRRLAATIPALSDAMAQAAAAVVASDSVRAATIAEFRAGRRSVDQAVEAIDQQTRETLAFLEMLGAYNRAIGQYVTTVLPAAVSEEQLVGALVIESAEGG